MPLIKQMLACSYAEGFIQNCSDWAVGMGKPVVLEEFGMARDAWRNPLEPLYKYNPGTPVTHKDRYYEHIFNIIEKLASHGAFSGANFWAYSGEGYPNQPPNEFDMVWLGGKATNRMVGCQNDDTTDPKLLMQIRNTNHEVLHILPS
jgi:mannan endo-1,4-beta-mannosidase